MFRKGEKVEIFKKSSDESWQDFMDDFVGLHGIITDPDTAINDPDALVEVSLVDKGTYRIPQDCLRRLKE
jgi:hypothetical protein